VDAVTRHNYNSVGGKNHDNNMTVLRFLVEAIQNRRDPRPRDSTVIFELMKGDQEREHDAKSGVRRRRNRLYISDACSADSQVVNIWPGNRSGFEKWSTGKNCG